MLVHSPAQGNLLPLLGAHWARQLHLGHVALHAEHPCPRTHRSDVKHKHLVLAQLLNLGLLLSSLRPHTQEPPEEEEVDLNLDKDVGELSDLAKHLPHEPVRPGQRWVNRRTNANQSSRNGVLELVVLREEGHNPGEDGVALDLALRVLAHDSWPHLNFLTHLEDPLQYTAASDATLEVVHSGSRFVHVKRSNHNHLWGRGEVPHRHRNFVHDVLAHRVYVVPQLGRDWDYGASIGDRSLDEPLDGVVLVDTGRLGDQVNLVLKNDDMLQPHDLHGCEMLRGLRLGARLVRRDKEQGSVHNRRTVKHGSHENIVARAVHEGDVPQQVVSRLALLADWVVLLARSERPEASWARARGVAAAVDLCVCVPELDGDVPLQLVLEANCRDARDGLDDCGLSVSHVPDGSQVDRGLPRDHLRAQRSQLRHVERAQVLFHETLVSCGHLALPFVSSLLTQVPSSRTHTLRG
mmetsp:Transcript_8881/g.25337  ORF Transcript_8881/g.25337 Transcript_8881/m.25337 type:complete len:465 (-) Transcript_8881:10-1404(-)